MPESEVTVYAWGADRSAGRALPLLLLPDAAQLRAALDEGDGSATFDRVARAASDLAREAVADEVPLYLARGLEHLWRVPCSGDRPCHHEVGLQIVAETMRYSVLGDWDPDAGRRKLLALQEPFVESLAIIDDHSILETRLDAAIRALAPAAVASICVSIEAMDLLLAVLDAQRRALLTRESHQVDDRSSRTLVAARALLTLAYDGDDSALYSHIDAYADNSSLLSKLLGALSAAAEETTEQATTARRVWPNLVRHVLGLTESGHTPFQDSFYGDRALSGLLPNLAGEVEYLYREVRDEPIAWWEPTALRPEVEAWVPVAEGRAECVDQLISFLRALACEDQVRTGLAWVSRLVLASPATVARRSYFVTEWLIEVRCAAEETGLLADWQQVVDALVVAGVTKLAPYSV